MRAGCGQWIFEQIEATHQQQHDRHEGQLAGFDADIEQQQGDRNVPLRQTKAGKPAGESEPMHEPEQRKPPARAGAA